MTREILGLTQKEFAESAGILLSRYNLREAGKISLPLSFGIQLCDAHDLTLEWLYRGKVQGLPIWLAGELTAWSALLPGTTDTGATDGREANGGSSAATNPLDEHPANANAERRDRRTVDLLSSTP